MVNLCHRQTFMNPILDFGFHETLTSLNPALDEFCQLQSKTEKHTWCMQNVLVRPLANLTVGRTTHDEEVNNVNS